MDKTKPGFLDAFFLVFKLVGVEQDEGTGNLNIDSGFGYFLLQLDILGPRIENHPAGIQVNDLISNFFSCK